MGKKFKKNGFKYLEIETAWVKNGIFKMLLLRYHYNVFKNNVMTLLPFHVKVEYLLSRDILRCLESLAKNLKISKFTLPSKILLDKN